MAHGPTFFVFRILVMKTARFCLALILSFVIGHGSVFAQAWRGALRGRVADASGVPIPGAQIGIRNQATGVTREVVTAGDRRVFDTGALAGAIHPRSTRRRAQDLAT